MTNVAYFATITSYKGFFEEWEASLSLKIKKYGWVEGWRTALSGLVQGTLIKSCLRNDFQSLASPMIVYVPLSVMTCIISVALLFGTQSEMKSLKLPKIQLLSCLHFK